MRAKDSSSNVLSFIQIQITLQYYLNIAFVYFNKIVTFMILCHIFFFITPESMLFFLLKTFGKLVNIFSPLLHHYITPCVDQIRLTAQHKMLISLSSLIVKPNQCQKAFLHIIAFTVSRCQNRRS